MPLAIAHFAIGIIFGVIILLLFNFKNEIKYDILILGASGLFAMLPDIGALWGNFTTDHSWFTNICWFHHLIDKLFTDTPLTAFFFILVAVVLVAVYFLIEVK